MRIEILRHHGASMSQSRFVVFAIFCHEFYNSDLRRDAISAHLRLVLTSGTHAFGHVANFTLGIFGKVSEPIMFTRWLDSITGSSTTPSVNDCNQPGKESLPASAGVDCLVTATSGTWFVRSTFICDSEFSRWLLSCLP